MGLFLHRCARVAAYTVSAILLGYSTYRLVSNGLYGVAGDILLALATLMLVEAARVSALDQQIRELERPGVVRLEPVFGLAEAQRVLNDVAQKFGLPLIGQYVEAHGAERIVYAVQQTLSRLDIRDSVLADINKEVIRHRVSISEARLAQDRLFGAAPQTSDEYVDEYALEVAINESVQSRECEIAQREKGIERLQRLEAIWRSAVGRQS